MFPHLTIVVYFVENLRKTTLRNGNSPSLEEGRVNYFIFLTASYAALVVQGIAFCQ